MAVHGKQLCGDVTTGSTHDRQLNCNLDMNVLSSTCGTVTSSLAASVRRSNSRCVSACACATSSSRPAGRHQKGKEASSCVQRFLTKPGSVNHAQPGTGAGPSHRRARSPASQRRACSPPAREHWCVRALHQCRATTRASQQLPFTQCFWARTACRQPCGSPPPLAPGGGA